MSDIEQVRAALAEISNLIDLIDCTDKHNLALLPLFLAEQKRALAALAHIEQAGGWQPITSAPKDGTKILLGQIVGHPDHPTALWWARGGHWSAKWHNWNDGTEPAGLAGPTHWALLPSKPRARKEQP